MIYDKQIKNIINQISSSTWDLKIAMVADSHLDNSIGTTIENIKAVDQQVRFDCLIHLGDFLNGNLPRNCSKALLKEQMGLFKETVSSGVFYPTQGNHDGYLDLCIGRPDIALDEDWYEATSFVDCYPNVSREEGAPYYYVDILEKKLRLIAICSFYLNTETGGKEFGISEKQLEWLEHSALQLEQDWTIMLFSHDTPFSKFDNDALIYSNNNRINGTGAMKLLKQAREEKGFEIAAWFIGHFHGDLMKRVDDIPFVLLSSETAYVPQLWKMVKGGQFPERILGTDTEDLWDAVCLDQQNKILKLFRCGSGEDREVRYGTL